MTFGSRSPRLENRPLQEHARTQAGETSETYISKTLVVGAFLAIFCVQVGINFMHAVRNGRRRRQAMELQFPQPLPQLDRGRNRNPEPGAYPDANTNVHEYAGDG